MFRRVARVLVLLALLAVTPNRAHAQTTITVTVTYPAGWNMVGAPSGTVLTALGPLQAWTGTQYEFSSSHTAAACAGYWSDQTAPVTVTFPATTPPATQVCPLQQGWNLVGNPLPGTANIPSDTLAYTTTPGTTAYAQIHSLNAGTAAWIYAATAGSVTFTFQQPSPPPPATLVINNANQTGPYTVHVGDRVELLNNAAYPVTATEDWRFFKLLDAGQTGDATCGTQGQCQFNLANQFWLYQATAAGYTSIRIDPVCPVGQQTCTASWSIPFTIVSNS